MNWRKVLDWSSFVLMLAISIGFLMQSLFRLFTTEGVPVWTQYSLGIVLIITCVLYLYLTKNKEAALFNVLTCVVMFLAAGFHSFLALPEECTMVESLTACHDRQGVAWQAKRALTSYQSGNDIPLRVQVFAGSETNNGVVSGHGRLVTGGNPVYFYVRDQACLNAYATSGKEAVVFSRVVYGFPERQNFLSCP